MILNKNKYGFTVLESILALAVFGLIVIGLLSALNDSAKGVSEAIMIEQIANKMQSLMQKEIHSNNTIEGTKVIKESDITYTIITKSYEVKNEQDEDLEELYTVSIEAVSPDNINLNMETLIYSPDYSTLRIKK